MSAFYNNNNSSARFGGRVGLGFDALNNGFQVDGSIPANGRRFNRSNIHDLDFADVYGNTNQWANANQNSINNLGQWGWKAQNDLNNLHFNRNNLDAFNNIDGQLGFDNQFDLQSQWDNVNTLNNWQRRQLARRALFGGNRSFDDFELPRRFNNIHNIANQLDLEDVLLRRNTFGGRQNCNNINNIHNIANQIDLEDALLRRNALGGARRSFDDLDLLHIQNRLRRNGLTGSRLGVNNVDNEIALYETLNQLTDLDDLVIQKLINQARYSNALNRGRNGIEEELIHQLRINNIVNGRNDIEDELRHLQAQRQQALFGRTNLYNNIDNVWDLEDSLPLQHHLLNIANRNRDRRLRRNANNQSFGFASGYDTADELDLARQLRRAQWQNKTRNLGEVYDDVEFNNTLNTTRFGRGNRFQNPQVDLERKLAQLHRGSRVAKGLGVNVIRVADVIEDAVENVFDVLDNNVRRRYAGFPEWH
ncbi:hypothetical protein HK097_009740 [Rhizophlyctis rosea]|uniref:Uncharacterized protein n=1 Tax=Rhizophlyctis rosea TaxID=64517 RepID=A0AAD5SAU6_9FUNG|nr:hypothetical protein HK097_009740 [Rhizophlyctis rosea]